MSGRSRLGRPEGATEIAAGTQPRPVVARVLGVRQHSSLTRSAKSFFGVELGDQVADAPPGSGARVRLVDVGVFPVPTARAPAPEGGARVADWEARLRRRAIRRGGHPMIKHHGRGGYKIESWSMCGGRRSSDQSAA